jgi:hypothetical protein
MPATILRTLRGERMSAPSLAELQRWMTEMPAAFLAEPEGFGAGRVRVRAVIEDLFETLFAAPPDPELAAALQPANRGARERNRLRLCLVTAHLLWNPHFRRPEQPRSGLRGGLLVQELPRAGLRGLFVQELPALAAVVQADEVPRNEQLREELIRRTLRALGWGLAGESPAEFEDRLRQVDSVERHKLLREAAERERRAREVREAMAKKAAQEAAAKVSRE